MTFDFRTSETARIMFDEALGMLLADSSTARVFGHLLCTRYQAMGLSSILKAGSWRLPKDYRLHPRPGSYKVVEVKFTPMSTSDRANWVDNIKNVSLQWVLWCLLSPQSMLIYAGRSRECRYGLWEELIWEAQSTGNSLQYQTEGLVSKYTMNSRNWSSKEQIVQ